MRQHVNPLSKNFNQIEKIPLLSEIFKNPNLPLHLDVGCASGDFLFDLALENDNWNYIGIEIREKLVRNAQSKLGLSRINNLYFSFGNANNILSDEHCQDLINCLSSISFYFPDPWFKKKHSKRRVIQTELINVLSNLMQQGSLIYIKTDVRELFEHMEFTISGNLKFQKIDYEDFNFSAGFNPSKIKTNREQYVSLNKFLIFESIYIKI